MHKHIPNLFVFLDQYNNQIFQNSNTNIGVIYRNYNYPKKDDELIKIAKACKRKRFLFFVSNDVKLALKAKADGIYIPSFSKTKKFLNFEKKNFIVIGSAHNQKEIHEKISQKCKAIFLSPVFFMKKSKNFMGIHKFNSLSYSNAANILALGGINEHNIHKLKLLHSKGFGGISLFKKKPALKKAGFLKF